MAPVLCVTTTNKGTGLSSWLEAGPVLAVASISGTNLQLRDLSTTPPSQIIRSSGDSTIIIVAVFKNIILHPLLRIFYMNADREIDLQLPFMYCMPLELGRRGKRERTYGFKKEIKRCLFPGADGFLLKDTPAAGLKVPGVAFFHCTLNQETLQRRKGQRQK